MSKKHIAVSLLGVIFLGAAALGCGTKTRPNYTATLDGSQIVPPVQTAASGDASFVLSEDSSQLTYTLNVKDLSSPIMAHLHLGKAGANGPPVVWLYPDSSMPKEIPGVMNGALAKGTISAKNFVGPMQGKSMSDLLSEIKSGDVYVNVHTKANPDGEIRGEVRAAE